MNTEEIMERAIAKKAHTLEMRQLYQRRTSDFCYDLGDEERLKKDLNAHSSIYSKNYLGIHVWYLVRVFDGNKNCGCHWMREWEIRLHEKISRKREGHYLIAIEQITTRK